MPPPCQGPLVLAEQWALLLVEGEEEVVGEEVEVEVEVEVVEVIPLALLFQTAVDCSLD